MEEKNLFNIINKSKSKNEILMNYFGYANKLTYNKLNNFIGENNINVSHLEKKIKYCLNCGKIVKKCDNKFCDSSCAATYNNRKRLLSDTTKLKISNSVKNNCFKNKKISPIIQIKRICIICNIEFIVPKVNNNKLSKSKCCSNDCHIKLRIKNGKIIVNERIANGTHKGWKTRNIVSYPELFFIEVLNNNNIKFKHNHPINKRDLGLKNMCNYFLDFFIENKKIDLEIDGQQHDRRKKYDEYRDEILIKNGYVVYRIKWKNINTKNGNEYIKNEIDKFLEFYNKI